MTRRFWPALAAVLGLGATMAWPQDPVFRTGVSLVRVDVQVTNELTPVGGLRKQDFAIQDNGQEMPVMYVSQEEDPLDLLLLFDISQSMAPAIRKVAASGRTALKELRKGDRVAIADFNTDAWLMAPFNDDLEEVAAALDRVVDLRFGGGTHILSSVNEAARYFAKNGDPHRRHAVLIFTDDDGQVSMGERAVVNHMWESDILLCGLIINTPGRGMFRGQESMQGVAAKTGGEIVNADEPGLAFRQMLRRMRLRYSLYYEMPAGKPGASRRVSVDLSVGARSRYPNGQVLARKGYVIPKVTTAR